MKLTPKSGYVRVVSEDANHWLEGLKNQGMVPRDARLPVTVSLSEQSVNVSWNTDKTIADYAEDYRVFEGSLADGLE